MEMTLDQIRSEITLALAPVHQSLESLQREQRGITEQVWKQGLLLARLEARSTLTPPASSAGGRLNGNAKPAASGAALNGHAKTMGGAGMMAVVWALVEIIQVLIAAP